MTSYLVCSSANCFASQWNRNIPGERVLFYGQHVHFYDYQARFSGIGQRYVPGFKRGNFGRSWNAKFQSWAFGKFHLWNKCWYLDYMPIHKQILWSPNLITFGLFYFSASGISEKVGEFKLTMTSLLPALSDKNKVLQIYYIIYSIFITE